jgi:hypothetical protein
MMNGPRVFWPSGGDVVSTHCRLIAPAEAERLRALYLCEAEASARAGDHRTREDALRLADELRQALEAAGRWRRAARATYEVGGAANRVANSSRELTLGKAPSGIGRPRKPHNGSHPSATS